MSIVQADFSRLSVVVSEARRNLPRHRDPAAVINSVLNYASKDREMAIGCIYSIPRGDKTVRGPSVRLAEILRYFWGGIWLEEVDVIQYHDHVVAKVIGVDVLTGNLTSALVPEPITKNDVNGVVNAKRIALSKAKRNVILDLIPASLVFSRLVVQLRAKLLAQREDIEKEYKASISALSERFKMPVEALEVDLESKLNVPRYESKEDEKKKRLSTDFMLTVIEYMNALQDSVVEYEPGKEQTEPQNQVQTNTENHVNTDAFTLQPEPVPEPQPHAEPAKKVRPIRR
jgi:hypothetical protein